MAKVAVHTLRKLAVTLTGTFAMALFLEAQGSWHSRWSVSRTGQQTQTRNAVRRVPMPDETVIAPAYSSLGPTVLCCSSIDRLARASSEMRGILT
jgi:hypothetical protein